MKKFTPWLLPLFTALAVFAAAVLPSRISSLRDEALFARVHTEDLSGESSLPLQPPDLTRRLHLLARWTETDDILTVQRDTTEEALFTSLQDAAMRQLHNLSDAGPLPRELTDCNWDLFYASELYLQEKLTVAEFYCLSVSSKAEETHLWMILDAETMCLLWLEFSHPLMGKVSPLDLPANVGQCFLEAIGLLPQLAYESETDAFFLLPDSNLAYSVTLSPYFLCIRPTALYMEAETPTDAAAVFIG